MRPLSLRLVILSFCTLAAAAGAGAQTVRQDLEPQIVENKAPSLSAARAWRVDPKPILTLGDPTAPTEGDSLYEFGRVMGLTRLRSGHWAIGLPTSIRVFDASGKYQRTMGRAGEGPGEFRQIMGLRPTQGDTLLITDLSEVEYYAGDGKFIGQGASRRTTPGTYVWPSSVLGDGTYIGLNYNDRSVTPPAGRQRQKLPLYRVSRDGMKLDTLATIVAADQTYDGRSPYGRPVTFTSSAMLAAAGTRVLYSHSELAEITEFTTAGKVVRRIRLAVTPRPVTTLDQDEYKKWMLELSGEDGRPVPPQLRAQREQGINQAGFAATFPVYSLMLTDRSGNIWLRRFDVRQQRYKPGPVATITTDIPTSWDVVDVNGRWLCTVETPAKFTPLEVGADYMVGVAHNADDVEMIRVYRIVKP